MENKKSIAVAKGDGIGPEIMAAVLNIFNKTGVPLDYKFIDMGRDIFLAGHKLGMTPEAKETVEDIGVLFKGPMETPKGGGNKSINVIARKMWGTFANCRVFKTLPGVDTVYSKANIPINLTIIRENIEDTYGGIEHMITDDLAISRRIISAPGSYSIHKYAFEYAKQQGLKSVVCGHKANIMKLTDGLFLEIFYEVAKEYPEITASDIIVDDLCMKLVTVPNKFEVIVLPNLQGDIVSDLCAGLVGGLGFAPSANLGNNVTIFEAVHGTAPDIAGKNLANPTALLMSGLMMLHYLGFSKHAKKIELAMLQTLNEKIHTIDVKTGNNSVSTDEYANAIIERALKIKDSDIGEVSNNSIKLTPKPKTDTNPTMLTYKNMDDTCKGVDLFIKSTEDANKIANVVNPIIAAEFKNFKLDSISNRGTAVYPSSSKYTENVNSYTLRFLSESTITEQQGLELALAVSKAYKMLSVEFLREYNGKIGYSNV